MSLITIFSAPKAFTNAHINIIQRNAIQSWKALGDAIDVILVGDDPGTSEAAAEFGVKHLPGVRCNEKGTPLVSSIFEMASEASNSRMLCYVNADIILLPDLITTSERMIDQLDEFLAVGQRWDMDITKPLHLSEDWFNQMYDLITKEGALLGPTGIDYFLYPANQPLNIPDFAIGRAGWDNWMIYNALKQNWPVIDATYSINVIHQNHDYSHLPGGKTHYDLQESKKNVELAGGADRMYTLLDVNYRYRNGSLEKNRKSLEQRLQALARWLGAVDSGSQWLNKAVRKLQRIVKKYLKQNSKARRGN